MTVTASVKFKLILAQVLVADQPAPDGTTPTVETYRATFQPLDPDGALVAGGDNFVYDTTDLDDTLHLSIGHTYRLSLDIEDGGTPSAASATTRRTSTRPVRE